MNQPTDCLVLKNTKAPTGEINAQIITALLGMKPPKYLKPGDVVELGVEGLGSSRQNVVAETI